MAKKLIPFWLFPMSWGLSGAMREEAKAHYELEGERLERRLIDIRFSDDRDQREREILKIDLKYNHIKSYDFDIAMAKLENGGEVAPKKQIEIDAHYGKVDAYTADIKIAEIDYPNIESLDYQIAALTVDFKHGKITKQEYEKTLATAKNEPWVGIVENDFRPEDGVNGFEIELDWNPQWVETLRASGYQGFTEEQVVEQWFSDVCRSTADMNPVEPLEPVPFNSSRIVTKRRDNGDGTSEYS